MLEDDLRAELDRALVEPLRAVLGDATAEAVAAQLDERVPGLAADLLGEDQAVAGAAARSLGWLIRPRPLEWWRTPLGIVLAAQGVPIEEVSARHASQLLDVGRARVYQLLNSGKLVRGPGGGVTIESIGKRLAAERAGPGTSPGSLS